MINIPGALQKSRYDNEPQFQANLSLFKELCPAAGLW